VLEYTSQQSDLGFSKTIPTSLEKLYLSDILSFVKEDDLRGNSEDQR